MAIFGWYDKFGQVHIEIHPCLLKIFGIYSKRNTPQSQEEYF